MNTILLVVGILVLLIVAHELGHFIAAKIFRVRVEEFGVGYPPRAFTFGTWGGTEYTLNWIPFGGFVRLYGDIGQGERGKGSFVDAHRSVQALILVAGVCANVIAAWVLFVFALHSPHPRLALPTDSPQEVRLMVSDIVPGSPAAASGILPGDNIVEIQDAKDASPESITPMGVTDFVKTRGGQSLTVSYVHAGTPLTTTIIPAHGVLPGTADRPALGIALVSVTDESLSWGASMILAFPRTYDAFVNILGGLGMIAGNLIHGPSALQDVVGPVGLVGIVGDAAQNGWGNVLALAAFISVNLAIVNLLPIPALDGGRLFLLAIEAIMRRNAPRLAVQLLNTLGIAFIAFLMITVTYHDIARLLT